MVFFQIVTDGVLFQAGQPDQPGAAELLHRHHGAGHAADHRRRPYRPFGRLDRRLHRRPCRRAAGAVGIDHFVPATSACLCGGADRRGAGLLGRLSEDSVLHRDAGRHAGLPRPDSTCCSAGPVDRAVPAGFPAARLGFIPDFFGGDPLRRHARCCSASLAPGCSGLSRLSQPRRTRRSTARKTSPSRSSSARMASSPSLIFLRLPALDLQGLARTCWSSWRC